MQKTYTGKNSTCLLSFSPVATDIARVASTKISLAQRNVISNSAFVRSASRFPHIYVNQLPIIGRLCSCSLLSPLFLIDLALNFVKGEIPPAPRLYCHHFYHYDHFLSFNFYHYPQFLPQCRSWEFCQSWGPASSRRSSPQYQSSYWDILSDTEYLSKVSSHLFLVFIIIILIIIISSYIIYRESHKNLVKGEIPPAPRLLVNLNFQPLQHLVWRKM